MHSRRSDFALAAKRFRASDQWRLPRCHQRAASAAAVTTTITGAAVTIADSASAAVISAADATCSCPMAKHHRRPLDATTLITAGASSTVLGVVLAAKSTLPSPPAFCCSSTSWRWSSPYPFKRPTFPAVLDRLSRGLYVTLLCGSSRTLAGNICGLGRGRSAGRGRGRRSLTCACMLRYHTCAYLRAVALSLSFLISHYDFALAAVASRPHLTRSILEYVILAGSSVCRTKALADSLHHCAPCRKRVARMGVIGHH